MADELRTRGIIVWLDVDNMSGSTLEAMASAVENAYVVIVVLSKAYKSSTACRTEAEYAYTLKKPVVPVKFNDYMATGWLGALMGTKLWFNLGGLTDEQYAEKIGAMCTEIDHVAKRHRSSTSLPPTSLPTATASRFPHSVAVEAAAAPPSTAIDDDTRLDGLEAAVRSAVETALAETFAKARFGTRLS